MPQLVAILPVASLARYTDAAKLLGESLELSPTVKEVLEEFT